MSWGKNVGALKLILKTLQSIRPSFQCKQNMPNKKTSSVIVENIYLPGKSNIMRTISTFVLKACSIYFVDLSRGDEKEPAAALLIIPLRTFFFASRRLSRTHYTMYSVVCTH